MGNHNYRVKQLILTEKSSNVQKINTSTFTGGDCFLDVFHNMSG